MRIGRICRLRLSSRFNNPAIWLGIFAFASGVMLGPALAQGPPGAVAAAAGAAAAATVAAPAPAVKKTAASAAIAAAEMGNSAVAQVKANGAITPAPTEEATNGTPAAGPVSPAASAPAPLIGVAAQCASLLKMATDLKAEVAKTTKDVLSVAVIRDAGQIEETAKKMREQQH